MSKLLTPPGLVKTRYVQPPFPSNLPVAERDPMPGCPGAVILTSKGARRLLPEEVYRGLWGLKDEDTPTTSVLERTTSVFLWEALALSLEGSRSVSTNLIPAPVFAPMQGPDLAPTMASDPPVGNFVWHPPNLEIGSDWYCARVRTLRIAANASANPEQVVQDGLEILNIHRRNYDASGPKPQWLQVIWWEFPPEHWTALRQGGGMNFLKPPLLPQIHPNAPMNAEQTAVAVEFVEEPLNLGVLCDHPSQCCDNLCFWCPTRANQVNGVSLPTCCGAVRTSALAMIRSTYLV